MGRDPSVDGTCGESPLSGGEVKGLNVAVGSGAPIRSKRLQPHAVGARMPNNQIDRPMFAQLPI